MIILASDVDGLATEIIVNHSQYKYFVYISRQEAAEDNADYIIYYFIIIILPGMK